ncbi:MAG: ATP-binding cassette domain-containing protein [Desulfomonile tiedjei]|uniref:ATP-binding cassette domain-containing protein n=1 Tax=Desulfomonile tiedjei TaxID=2358 RepID=A0A9D6V2A2_9BACT|nr:ATP-binding cassette domain-containing protein [Desulfomonile tiedjei]
MIIAENVSFTYPRENRPALDGVSFTVENRAWVAVTGRIGSGKTTLCKILKGLLKPTAGKVRLTEPHADFPRVAYLGGDPYDTLVGTSVEEDAVFGMENFEFPLSEMKVRLKQALAWTHLTGMEKRLVNTLSGGEQQKLALAGALASGASVLILDEATSMLDRPVRKSIRTLINSLRTNPGLTIVEVTHDPEYISLADNILFVESGKAVFQGTYPEFLTHPCGESWTRAGWGLASLRREMADAGICLSDCRGNSQLSECLLKFIKK